MPKIINRVPRHKYYRLVGFDQTGRYVWRSAVARTKFFVLDEPVPANVVSISTIDIESERTYFEDEYFHLITED